MALDRGLSCLCYEGSVFFGKGKEDASSEVYMQNQQIPVITQDYIVSLHTMLEQLTVQVERIGATLENITVPVSQATKPAPDNFEVSLSYLAAATGISKSTVERRIADSKLPKPRTNPDNGYRYWLKSNLPQNLRSKIDERYSESAKASRVRTY